MSTGRATGAPVGQERHAKVWRQPQHTALPASGGRCTGPLQSGPTVASSTRQPHTGMAQLGQHRGASATLATTAAGVCPSMSSFPPSRARWGCIDPQSSAHAAPVAQPHRRRCEPQRAVLTSAAQSPPASSSSSSSSSSSPAAAAGASAVRPPSPSLGRQPAYFEGFCADGAQECLAVWEQLRWCTSWRQMERIYNNLLAAEAAAQQEAAAKAAASRASAAVPAEASPPGSSGSGGMSVNISIDDIATTAASAILSVAAAAAASSPRDGSGNSSGSDSDSPSSSMDQTTATRVAAVVAEVVPPTSAADAQAHAAASAAAVTAAAPPAPPPPALLGREETYAFLLQVQDFYHQRLGDSELDELQAFRCRLVRDFSTYVRRMDAEQLEALCCASAVSGKCLSRERADAVQQRLLKILSITTPPAPGVPASLHPSSAAAAAAAAAASRKGRSRSAGGFQVLTPALNTIFALYDHGYLPQVDLLQAVFRQAVDHLYEVTRSQWHGLHGLARRFRFLLDDLWLDDLNAALRDPLASGAAAADVGRLSSVLGCIAAFTVNGAMEPLDTRVLVVVEAIERRYDEGRSLLTAHQLCVFTALLMDMRSPFCAKWLRHTLGYMGSCRSHLAGLSPSSLVLAVELTLRGRGWDEQRLLAKLLRQLFSTYAKHPAAAMRASSNGAAAVARRAPSRIFTAGSSSMYVNNVSLPNGASSSSTAAQPSLAALAAAAAWDVDVGGAATVPYDIVTLVDWLAAKLPSAPGPDRQDALAFLQPLVRSLVESSRTELPSLDPPRIPAMIKSVALLGYSPSREWVAEAFQCAARSASQLSGAELVAMLRVSHAQQIPLPLPTLDAVCREHARILPLMRAVDLQRLLECWVADKYIPSPELLTAFFDAVCDSFGIDVRFAKAGSRAPGLASLSPSPTTSMDGDSDSDSSIPVGSNGFVGYDVLDVMQPVRGTMSAGAADGLAGSLASRAHRASRAHADDPPASAPTRSSSTAVAASSTSGAQPFTAEAVNPTAIRTSSTTAMGRQLPLRPTTSSLGSLDTRPTGTLLQPAEAAAMLSLLDQYRALLLDAKRSDLLVAMNPYRSAVTAALHTMRRVPGAGGDTAAAASRLLQAALKGQLQAGKGKAAVGS